MKNSFCSSPTAMLLAWLLVIIIKTKGTSQNIHIFLQYSDCGTCQAQLERYFEIAEKGQCKFIVPESDSTLFDEINKLNFNNKLKSNYITFSNTLSEIYRRKNIFSSVNIITKNFDTISYPLKESNSFGLLEKILISPESKFEQFPFYLENLSVSSEAVFYPDNNYYKLIDEPTNKAFTFTKDGSLITKININDSLSDILIERIKKGETKQFKELLQISKSAYKKAITVENISYFNDTTYLIISIVNPTLEAKDQYKIENTYFLLKLHLNKIVRILPIITKISSSEYSAEVSYDWFKPNNDRYIFPLRTETISQENAYLFGSYREKDNKIEFDTFLQTTTGDTRQSGFSTDPIKMSSNNIIFNTKGFIFKEKPKKIIFKDSILNEFSRNIFLCDIKKSNKGYQILYWSNNSFNIGILDGNLIEIFYFPLPNSPVTIMNFFRDGILGFSTTTKKFYKL